MLQNSLVDKEIVLILWELELAKEEHLDHLVDQEVAQYMITKLHKVNISMEFMEVLENIYIGSNYILVV